MYVKTVQNYETQTTLAHNAMLRLTIHLVGFVRVNVFKNTYFLQSPYLNSTMEIQVQI